MKAISTAGNPQEAKAYIREFAYTQHTNTAVNIRATISFIKYSQ